jgi:NADH-quinone oxidoreductase subunit H
MYKPFILVTLYPHIFGPYIELVLVLLFLLLGGLLPLVERKFLAQIQNRVGPEVLGFKGRLQFVADAVKVLVKNSKET